VISHINDVDGDGGVGASGVRDAREPVATEIGEISDGN
jgi:hypothetical protein